MIYRRLPLAVLIVLALAACGGSAAKQRQEKATAAAEAQWRTALTSWGTSMTRALNGISVVFSQPAQVKGIEASDPRTLARLRRLEQTLLGCTVAVTRLGDAPATLADSHREALHACLALEQGASLVRSGVREVQNGLGVDLLNRSSVSLAAGQDGVRRAELDLTPSPS